MRKILIIHTSVAGGHRVVAESIAQQLRKNPGLKVELLDIMKIYQSVFVTRIGPAIYQRLLVDFPGLWRFFYNNKVFHKLTLPLRIPLAAIRARKLLGHLQEIDPDLILTTQSIATALVSYLKMRKKFSRIVVTTFSDYHFQSHWAYPGVDQYLAVIAEQAAGLEKAGTATSQVTVTGLPVEEAFLQEYNRIAVLENFGLSKTRPIILVMGGSLGLGIRTADIAGLLKLPYEMQIVVIPGNNETIRRKLRVLAELYPQTLIITEYLNNQEVAQLFSVAKLLVTKPGGLTITQALVKGLPMVLVNPLPGSEEMNRDYLMSRGAAAAASSPGELRSWVERLLVDRELYQRLKVQARKLALPDAAARASAVTIDMLEI